MNEKAVYVVLPPGTNVKTLTPDDPTIQELRRINPAIPLNIGLVLEVEHLSPVILMGIKSDLEYLPHATEPMVIPCTLEQKRNIEAMAITRGQTVTEFILSLVEDDMRAYHMTLRQIAVHDLYEPPQEFPKTLKLIEENNDKNSGTP